jgi:hypothetical protein
MRVILHIYCQIQGTISGLHYDISGPGKIPIHLLILLFRLQYSIEHKSVGICDMTTIQCALYSIFIANCRSQYAVYAMSNLAPVKYNKITTLAIQAAIFH